MAKFDKALETLDLEYEPHLLNSLAIGGFVEDPGSYGARGLLTPTQIAAFMPSSKGPFTFPAPWGTRGARITDSTDRGSADVVTTPGYSYWRTINAHSAEDATLKILISFQGLGYAKIFEYFLR